MGNKRKASSDTDKDSDASSGYFSALDQTDFEDIGPTGSAAQNMPTAPRVPFITGSHPGISPMIVMNNFVLKQPNSVAPALKPWSLNTSLDVVPQSQLLYLQPVGKGLPTGDSTSQSFDKPKHSRKYAPLQSTFQKIAPHPAQEPTIDQGPSAINKRSSHSPVLRHHRHRYEDKPFHNFSLKQDVSETFSGYGVDPSISSLEEIGHTVEDMHVKDSPSRLSDVQEPHTTTSPFSLCTDSFLAAFPQKCPKTSVSQSSDVESIPEALSPSSSKHKRFCNTYNILNRSGLLGITMRTKELIRQNKRSQAQLQSLQAQTDLFLEAICSGDPKIWTRLQLILQNSGNSEEMPVDSVKAGDEDLSDVGCMV
ncbi:CLOCK-interacting pacemaker a [Danio aesculapii]|uniref:CLOCK-interacting pacemaker a n=1 Tax=Danio aesculapii TaxID=1142201 RepID=UPI0024BF47CE|nr:CLOCK-interacting pacemaker a [Danio aesculapii]